MRTLKVIGSDPMSEKMRYDALTALNKLDDTTLLRLSKLANSAKARDWITNKWFVVKNFLGA